MNPSQTSNSLPQGFSIFQPTLGAPLQFFPVIGSKELDDMISAYIPGPASMQEKRATVTVDFLSYAQITGQTFKFYPVFSIGPLAESPVSDSVSSFNTSPATSSWDWSQPSAPSMTSSRSSISARHSRQSPPSTVSRHQTADFSHLPGMKIMTKDGRDVTNSASRGSKTKEQRDHAHLMRIIKACDSCRRKKIRCDPSHKKRSAASQAQPSPPSKSSKKTAKSAPVRVQQPSLSPPTVDADAFFTQAPIDWNASFTFDDLEIPDFAMPIASDELAAQADLIPQDYDFFFDPHGYLSSQESFASPSSASSKEASPLSKALADPSPWESGSDDTGIQPQSLYAARSSAGGSIEAYDDFNLYSPASSFSEDEHMVSIEASSERFSTKSQSQSPAQLSQSQSQSPSDLSQSSPDRALVDSWFNDGDGVDWSGGQDTIAALALNAGVQRTGRPGYADDQFYDAEWLCAPGDQQQYRDPGSLPVTRQGAANADLMEAYESTVSSDGPCKERRAQTETRSSTSSSGHFSTSSETENHSSTNFSGRSSTLSETVSSMQNKLASAEVQSPLPHTTMAQSVTLLSQQSTVVATATAEAGERVPTVVAEFSAVSSPPSPTVGHISPGSESSHDGEVSAWPDGSSGVFANGPRFRPRLSTQPTPVPSGSSLHQSVRQMPAEQTTADHYSGTASQGNVASLEAWDGQKARLASAARVVQTMANAGVFPEGSDVSLIQRSASGIHAPIVSTMAPLSSQLLLLVACCALVWLSVRKASSASLLLPVLALGMRVSCNEATRSRLTSQYEYVRKSRNVEMKQENTGDGWISCLGSKGDQPHPQRMALGGSVAVSPSSQRITTGTAFLGTFNFF